MESTETKRNGMELPKIATPANEKHPVSTSQASRGIKSNAPKLQTSNSLPSEEKSPNFNRKAPMKSNSTGWETQPMRKEQPDVDVEASFSWIGDKVRTAASHQVTCMVGCGGSKCKYCVPYGRFPQEDFVIDGVYSNWVSGNFLAFSRPSTQAIRRFNIVEKMYKAGIRTIINLQMSGEHNKCGYTLDKSGFSYNPEEFMAKNIYFYNFAWPDFGVPSISGLLDAVQVVDFSIHQGKVAIHCHAGKGRTGCLIACYLVYVHRVPASAAIIFVRKHRSGSIQTKGQVMMVKNFESYLQPHWVMFRRNEPRYPPFSLEKFLVMQKTLIHGQEVKILRHKPKIVYVLCAAILRWASGRSDALDGIDIVGESQAVPPELEALIVSYFDRRRVRTPRFNNLTVDSVSKIALSKSTENLSSAVLPDLRSQSSVSSNPDSKASLNLSLKSAEKAHSSFHNEVDYEMRLDDEGDKQAPYPLDSLMTPATDRQMKSLLRRRDSTSSIIYQDMLSKSMPAMAFDSVDGAVNSDKYLEAAKALANDYLSDEALLECIDNFEDDLNHLPRCWELVFEQHDPNVLTGALWDWFDQLAYPIMSMEEVTNLVYKANSNLASPEDAPESEQNSKQPLPTILAPPTTELLKNNLFPSVSNTILEILNLVASLNPDPHLEKEIIRKMLKHFTQTGLAKARTVRTEEDIVPSTRVWDSAVELFGDVLSDIKLKASQRSNTVPDSLTRPKSPGLNSSFDESSKLQTR